MDRVFSDIKKGNIKNIYLFFGEDVYKRRVYRDALKKALTSNEMNYSYFEGEEINFSSLYDVCVALPFFAERRLVVAENTGWFSAKTPKSTQDELLKLFADLPASTCLAFFEEEAVKTKKVYKETAAKGEVCECTHDSERAVISWLAKGFAQAQKRADEDALLALIERVGTDYEQLKKEYEKVVAYAAESAVVTKADVEAVTGHNVEGRVYEIINAASRRNAPLMLEKYNALVQNDVHPLIILASLRGQFELMLQTGELSNKGFSDAEIAGKTSRAEFIIRNTKKILSDFRLKEVEDIIEKITFTDSQIKSGNANERYAVELLLIEICA